MSDSCSSLWRSPDADREIKRKTERRSERAKIHNRCSQERWLFVWPLSLLLPSLDKVSDRRGKDKKRGWRRWVEDEAVLLVEMSGGCAGRQPVWQQESGTVTQLCFGVEGPSRLVSLYFIVREKKGRKTLETLSCTERQGRIAVRREKNIKVNRETDPTTAAFI